MDVIELNSICESIWDSCFDGLKKLCEYKLNRTPEYVSEVLAEVYLALEKEIRTKNIPTNPQAWLYAVANNHIKKKYSNIVREKERKQSIYDKTFDEIELAVFPDFDDALISDEDIAEMSKEIIAELTEEERKLLKYFHDENKSMKEIAVLLNKSVCAVKQKHYRLCIKVRKMVKERIENFL